MKKSMCLLDGTNRPYGQLDRRVGLVMYLKKTKGSRCNIKIKEGSEYNFKGLFFFYMGFVKIMYTNMGFWEELHESGI